MMGEVTKIQWCDHTFNPWRGCAHAELVKGHPHPGCLNCYAEAMSHRNPASLGKWGDFGTRSDQWKQPLKWNAKAKETGERKRVFCASLADVFEGWHGPVHDHLGNVWCRPPSIYENQRENWNSCDLETWQADHQGWHLVTLGDVRQELFRLIDSTPMLDWILLTKRPEYIQRFWPGEDIEDSALENYRLRENAWLVTSVSDQASANGLIPSLLDHRHLSPVLGISAEPLIGPINLRPFLKKLDWVIVGGESGPKARPCNLQWIRDIVKQCRDYSVPVFVKQLGSNVGYESEHAFPFETKDPKGGDPDEWPEDLRVREFPR